MKKESNDIGILERNLAKVTNQKRIRKLVLDILKVVDTAPVADTESVTAIRRIAAANAPDMETT